MRAKTVINDLIFKVMQKFDLKDVCFFDCETTGVPAKGLKWDADFEQFPHVVQLAWSLGDKEKVILSNSIITRYPRKQPQFMV